MKELVVISGKGGTGKTSLTASFAVLAEKSVVADCDVDAADLHLLLAPEVRERHEFRAGHEAVIREKDCIACGMCEYYCKFDAISIRRSTPENPHSGYVVDPVACEGCKVCVQMCPVSAIDFPETVCGEWMESDSRTGPMVHARLGIAAENSGKLVTLVRKEAKRIAEEQGRQYVLVDGSPGIGCPVIASLTGADAVLVVTEPTVSGEHDLMRVLQLAKHFQVPASIVVNKWDLNQEMTEKIENAAREAGATPVGRVR